MCRPKATRLRRDRRGQATVIGSIFFFMIAVTFLMFFYEVSRNQIIMQQYDAERVTETLDAELQVTPGGHILLWLNNRGPIPVRILRLWVIDESYEDETDNIHIHYPRDLGSTLGKVIQPWNDILIDSSIPGSIPDWDEFGELIEGHEYSIRIVTARGNIIEPRPFQAVSGETVTISAYPPWVSLAESEFGLDPSETPVYSISKDDVGNPYTQGDKAWLSIKNTGSVAFIITRSSRLIFKDTTTGDVYASEPDTWETFTWDGSWNPTGSGSIDLKKDSRVIYPYPREPYVIVLRFLEPTDAPGQGTKAPSGTYRVYLHISGYDENGNTYYQSIHYGTIPIE